MKLKYSLIFWITGIVFFSALFCGLFSIHVSSDNLKKEMIAAYASHANVVKESVRSIFQNELRVTQQIANATQIRSLDASIADDYLAAIVDATEFQTNQQNVLRVYSHFLVTNMKGEEIIHSLKVHKIPPVSLKGRDYFEEPAKGKEVICMPNISKSTGNKIFPLAVPVLEKGRQVGNLTGFINMEYLSELINRYQYTPNSYLMLVATGGDKVKNRVVASHYSEDLWERVLSEEDKEKGWAQVAKVLNGKYDLPNLLQFGETSVFPILENKRKVFVSVSPIGIHDWKLIMVAPQNELIKVEHLRTLTGVLVVGILFISFFMIFPSLFISSLISKPVVSLSRILQEISQGKGDLTVEIPVTSKNEIGMLSHNFNIFVVSLKNIIKKIKENSIYMKNTGEKLSRSVTSGREALNGIGKEMGKMKENIQLELEDVSSMHQNIAVYSEEIIELSRIIQEQSSRIHETSAVVQDMMRSITEIADGNSSFQEEIDGLNQLSVNGKNCLEEMNQTVNKVVNKSENLLEVNKMIKGIAQKTNLLAMNAAIEAAHAGEAGKGFSIVANEIRNLAEGTTAQSKEIHTNMLIIREYIDKVVEQTSRINDIFDHLYSALATVSNFFVENGRSLLKQKENSSQIFESLHILLDLTSGVKKGSETVGVLNEKLLVSAEELIGKSGSLKSSMENMEKGNHELEEIVTEISKNSIDNVENIHLILEEVKQFKI